LHDDTAQSLAYLALELDSILHNREVTSEKVVRRLTGLKNQVDVSLKEVRRFSHELRPGVLDQLGLIAALELLADELNERNQVQVTFNATGSQRRLTNEEEQALFRIAQEALSNVRKHAQATHAAIDIQFSRKKIRLTITDNGKGFPLSEVDDAAAKGRLGLIGIKERAHLIGGTLTLKSAPNKGTKIAVALANN
jgi:two-component system, NarL family, sensor histidine kinase DegS